MSKIPGDIIRAELGLNYALKEVEKPGSIEATIYAIDPATRPLERAKRLNPILEIISALPEAQAEAILDRTIKPHFGLKEKDLAVYRRDLKKLRKKNDNTAKDKSKLIAVSDNLIDLVLQNGNPAFLLKNGDLKIKTAIQIKGVTYNPPSLDAIPWLLPDGKKVIDCSSEDDTDAQLYDDLIDYLKQVSELPADGYYDLLALWLMHTYLLEKGRYSPMICLFAVPERGKTRTGKALIYLAYRGIHVESLRDAYIVRFANHFQGSIFFDVRELHKKAEKCGSEDILLQRFEKGAKVPRVLYPERGPFNDTVYFNIFGPTIIATNNDIHKILETRTILINMPESNRKFENDISPELGLDLKARLLAFRARNLNKDLPDINKPARGRLGDILKPLHQILKVVRPIREEIFLEMVDHIMSNKLIEKSEDIEAQILHIILTLKPRIEKGILPVKEITEKFNSDKSEKFKFTPQRIGRILGAMGFQKAKTRNGASAIIIDEVNISKMQKAYGLDKTLEISEISDSLAAKDEVSDDSDVSEVLDIPF